MKSYKRTERVADLVMQELAVAIQRSRNNPLFAGVTITHVQVTPDLAQARVFFTVFDKEKIAATLQDLQAAAGFFQHMLGDNIRLKKIPKLYFVYDEAIIRGQRLAALIDAAVSADKGSGTKR